MAEGPMEAQASEPATTPTAAQQEPALAIARVGLERGDYGLVVRQLEPLCEREPGRTPLGGEARMLLATALLGQGRSERAAAICRQLRGCADPELRRQAKISRRCCRPRGWNAPRNGR